MSAATIERQRSNRTQNEVRGEEPLFEVVLGQRVELAAMSSFSNQIANRILFNLFRFLENNPIGTALSEALFSIPTKADPTNQRRPDVAYLSNERWPLERQAPDTDPWPVVPNLAVEVLSPNDRIRDVNNKISEYFEAGVELIWVIDPHHENASVYTAPTKVNIIECKDTLNGGSVIPGFTLPMAKLFRL